MRVAVFCEAAADFSTATGLVDRVLREEGPGWVREHVEFRPLSDLREWVGTDGRPFFDVHDVHTQAQRRGIKLPRGQFKGQAGAFGALTVYTASLLARDEANRSGPVEAVVFVWDMDYQGDERRWHLDEGRKAPFVLPVILGCPDPEREAWVLAGFEPMNAVEHDRLEDERRSLQLDPCLEAHRLRDRDDGALRSVKRVLARLTDDDSGREERCWSETSLATLRARGGQSGLSAFLDEVIDLLVPMFEGPPRRSPGG